MGFTDRTAELTSSPIMGPRKSERCTRSVQLAAPPAPASASTLSIKVALRRFWEFIVCCARNRQSNLDSHVTAPRTQLAITGRQRTAYLAQAAAQ